MKGRTDATRRHPVPMAFEKPGGHGIRAGRPLKNLDAAESAPEDSQKVWMRRNPIRQTLQKPGCGGIQAAGLPKSLDAVESKPQDSRKVWMRWNPPPPAPPEPGFCGIQSARLLKNPDAEESNPRDSEKTGCGRTQAAELRNLSDSALAGQKNPEKTRFPPKPGKNGRFGVRRHVAAFRLGDMSPSSKARDVSAHSRREVAALPGRWETWESKKPLPFPRERPKTALASRTDIISIQLKSMSRPRRLVRKPIFNPNPDRVTKKIAGILTGGRLNTDLVAPQSPAAGCRRVSRRGPTAGWRHAAGRRPNPPPCGRPRHALAGRCPEQFRIAPGHAPVFFDGQPPAAGAWSEV